MSKKVSNQVKALLALKIITTNIMRPYIDEVAQLYKDRRIVNIATAEAICKKLSSKGPKIQESGIKMLNDLKEVGQKPTGHTKESVIKAVAKDSKILLKLIAASGFDCDLTEL